MAGARAVLFDLDDTLYPEVEFVRSGFRAVAVWSREALGLSEEESFDRLWGLFEGGVRGHTFDLWLDGQGEGVVRKAVAVYRAHTPRIRPFLEVPGLLAELGREFQLGVVTDGEPGMQGRKLGALGLGEAFGVVVCSGALGPEGAKPSPRPFLHALAQLGVGPGSAMYVGDNPNKDFLGARRAGLGSVWVRRKEGIYGGMEPPTADHRPDHLLESLAGLRELLDGAPARKAGR